MKKTKLFTHGINHSRDTAKYRMTRRVPVAQPHQRAQEVFEAIRREIQSYDEIHFVYIIDVEGHLLGVLSLKEIFHLEPHQEIGEALHKKALHTVFLDTHQEKAAYLALRQNLKVVPVVDENHVFQGTLTEDALLSILHKEVREDIIRLSGIHPAHTAIDNILEISVGRAIQHRLPWLLMGLVGGIFTAYYIGFFERTLEKNLILASFIPLIVYMSDAVGTQMEAFVIRDFALVQNLEFRPYFFKQLVIVSAIALLLGGALIGVGYFFFQDHALLLVLGFSLILAIVSSVFTGLIIPFLFRKLRQDPANASGPVATIVQDFLSVVIYFAIASWVLGF